MLRGVSGVVIVGIECRIVLDIESVYLILGYKLLKERIGICLWC